MSSEAFQKSVCLGGQLCHALTVAEDADGVGVVSSDRNSVDGDGNRTFRFDVGQDGVNIGDHLEPPGPGTDVENVVTLSVVVGDYSRSTQGRGDVFEDTVCGGAGDADSHAVVVKRAVDGDRRER